MSNPAVTKIAQTRIGHSKFWMDDNIGESIHIHLDDIRLDLKTVEFDSLSQDLIESINKLVDVDGFDCNHIDPVYLQLHLAKYLPYLVSTRIDEVYVGDLYVSHGIGFGCCKFEKIANSRAVKALNGDDSENNDNRASHHIGQTSNQRLESMKKSISLNGYGYNGNYIILYDDQMLVRDGQHRAACIFNSLGNIKIPVLRLYFKDLPENIDVMGKSLFRQMIMSLSRHRKKGLKILSYKVARKAYHSFKRLKNTMYIVFHKKELSRLEKIYYCKKAQTHD